MGLVAQIEGRLIKQIFMNYKFERLKSEVRGKDGLENVLTSSERNLYEFIKKSGEVMTTNLPPKMMGAIPQLVKKGFLEIYKKPTMLWSDKKRKFVRAKK